MKKIFFIVLLLAGGLTYALAQQSGSCGDNLIWTLDEDGTLTISGTGEMYNFDGCGPWGKGITQLILEEGITHVGNNAFVECLGLTGSLTLPKSLTSIGDAAFYQCSGLTGDLALPAGLTSIGNIAFVKCSGFTGSLTLPKSLTSIGDAAFYQCSGFTGSLTLPASLTSIENYAFSECSGFTGSLTLPDGLTSIGNNAFKDCSGFTGDLILPASLTSIEYGAFEGCSGFTGLSLPAKLTSIRTNVFNGCSGFTGNLSLPAGLISIEDAAFDGCIGFTGDLILPASLTSVGYLAFRECSGFTGSLTLPDGLTSIGNNAFKDCSGFTGLSLPTKLTSIGYRVFNGCSGFTGNLNLPAGLTSIGEEAFDGCSGFTDTLMLPENLLSIGSKAFRNCGFSVVLNENKTPIVIEANVFEDLTLSDKKLCVPAGSGAAYSQAEVWKEFNIEEYGVGITPSFSENGGVVDCDTKISISTKPEAELYYGLGKDVAPTLRYTGPIVVVNDTTYISAYSRVRNVYSDTIRATYIPEHASFVGMDWDWSAEHKATLSLACSRCKTDIKPAVSLSEELTKEATKEEAGLKTYTATATTNEVTYKSINREVLPRLTQPIHDTVTITEVKTDTITITVTDTVYIEVGTGNTVADPMTVKLYPNPTNGSFTVEAEEDAYLQIYNAAGVCIQSKQMQGSRFTGTLPSSGLYFIKLTSHNRTYTKRLVVK